ncbi:unnamed protein product [Adineta steineri]|uniref:HAT C-terminal dimerisation domain-containing protein n=1 Tax=Adineta steineri TaxID=433720 RepID=A0A819LNI0_9BILA|nr:unnamed protein product [Adineta steineri]CAF3967267.1 unnamed protein product [Adineta steineri]
MDEENTDIHHSINTNSMDIDQTNDNNVTSIWDYMEKQKNEKAKCVCGVILSRKNGAATGMRKHLYQVHKLQEFGVTSTKIYGRSFSDMGQSGILKVFDHLVEGYIPPHQNTVQRNLKRLESECKALLIKELSVIQSVGVTCDFWSDKRLHSYICLTGHYISPNNEFISKILSFTSFHQRHFSSNISMIIKNELKELNVFEKTRSINTDGAANILKAVQMLGDVVPTTSNNTDDIDSDQEDLSDDIQIISQSLPVTNFSNSTASSNQSLVTTNQNFNINYDNIIMDETTSGEELDELSMDITDNWSIDLIECMDPSTCDAIHQHVGEVMKKCRSFVELINKSSILMNHVSNLKKYFKINRSLQLDCKSRWNSTYHLVEGMLMYKKLIYTLNSGKYDIGLNKKQTTKLSSIELKQDDWKMLELIEFILKPVVHATERVSGSKYATIGLSYFAIFQIREFLEDVDDHTVSDWKLLSYLKSLLLKQVQKYFFDNYTQLKTMKIHSYFDPIGYGCLTRREQRECESNIVELNEQLANEEVVDEIDINQTQSQINSQRKVEQSKPSTMTKFMHSIAQREYNSIVHEEEYPNTMNFWNEHRIQLKNLFKLATYHLVTPATSVTSESAFSTASYLLRKQRSRLTPQNLSSSMFLKDKINNEFNT